MSQQKRWQGEVLGLAALALVLGLPILFVTRTDTGRKLSGWEQAEAAPVAVLQPVCDLGPAPKLTRIKVKVGGKMGTGWRAESAGDVSYNGDYTKSGNYNGQPAYMNNNGRWLFYISGSWFLFTEKKELPIGGPYYTSLTGTLPSTWIEGGGMPPYPPTLSEITVRGKPPAPPKPKPHKGRYLRPWPW